MKIYIAGRITGLKTYEYRLKFGYRAAKLKEDGHKVINPVHIGEYLLSEGFDYEDVMKHCFSSIDVCDAVYMLKDWKDSPGATREHDYAKIIGKEIIYEE